MLFMRQSLIALMLFIVSAFNVVYADVHIRSLAGSCAACHGTNGNSVAGMVPLAGMDKAYFVTQMTAFKTGARPATVMHRHAAGLTIAEIDGLANFFAVIVPRSATTLNPQVFKP